MFRKMTYQQWIDIALTSRKMYLLTFVYFIIIIVMVAVR